MTKQEIFDTVVAHLRKQGRRAANLEGGCMYRAPNGDKCAVGCLIKDDEYIPCMEKNGVLRLVLKGLLPNRLKPHLELLADLQNTHDNANVDFTAETEAAFIRIARRFNLTLEPRT